MFQATAAKTRRRSVTKAALLCLALVPALSRPAAGAPEDILAGAFDKVTGVPFATIMLGIVRSQATSPLDPAALDRRLTQVEQLLRQVAERLTLVEQRLAQLQDEVAEAANIARLTKLQAVATELALINAELKLHPADVGARGILQLRARQQADLLRQDPELNVWMFTDLVDRGTPTQSLRTRFMVYPTFELYSIAIATWFTAIEAQLGTQPQRVVAELAPFLRAHQAFLETRPGLPDVMDQPQTLPERMHAEAFCRWEAVDRFTNTSGDCTFASVCLDKMAGTQAETSRQVFHFDPPRAGTLCTTSPAQNVGLQGEAELRAAYGEELMRSQAVGLAKLATTGSLADPFVGRFANFILTQLFSVPLARPVLSSPSAGPGALPSVPSCIRLVGGGCGATTVSPQTAWRITSPPDSGSDLSSVTNLGNSLCLDVKNGTPAVGVPVVLWTCNGGPSQRWRNVSSGGVMTFEAGRSNLCATVVPGNTSRLALQLSRSLELQPCDRRALQQFSGNDGTIRGPN